MLRYFNSSSAHFLKKKSLFQFNTIFKSFSTKLFSKDHEWVLVEQDIATVGITDYAQNELGEIVHCEHPKIGEKFKVGDSMGAIESVKTAADIYSPVEGVIQEINDKLSKNPKLLNTHAESQGWYVKIKVNEATAKTTTDELMSEEQYLKFVQEIVK